MKFYWSDREGNSPPPHCTFHLKPFSYGESLTFSGEEVILPPPQKIKVIKRTYLPKKEEWISNVQKALHLIDQKKLAKVVLARSSTLELETIPDPFAITAALKQRAQGAFLFCFQSTTESFLGASPERLFVRNGRQIVSEAVAGTRRRGKTAEEDEELKNELLKSEKDLREFAPVQAYLDKNLSPLCIDPLLFTPVSIHQTHNVQHLYSRGSGILKQTSSDQQILNHIHPTPALCGLPKDKATALIEELEPFQRGYYGGAIGWSTPVASEWIVGIRSCVIRGKTATLYSGTGIVEGSDPIQEWEELNHKLKLYEEIFI